MADRPSGEAGLLWKSEVRIVWENARSATEWHEQARAARFRHTNIATGDDIVTDLFRFHDASFDENYLKLCYVNLCLTALFKNGSRGVASSRETISSLSKIATSTAAGDSRRRTI